jgi:hypothetical protein
LFSVRRFVFWPAWIFCRFFCHGAVSHRLDVIECLFLHLGIVCLFSPPRRKGPAMRARPTPRVDLNSRMGRRSWGLRPDPWVGV